MNSTTDSRRAVYLFVTLVACWIPLIFGRDAVSSAADLFSLADSAHPYLIWNHPPFLYFWTPFVILSAFLFVLSPGLFFVLAMDSADEIGNWIVQALGISIVTISVLTAVAMTISRDSLSDVNFLWVVAVLTVIAFGLLLLQIRSGKRLRWPLCEPVTGHAIFASLLIPALLLIALLPKFYWENFNGDGVHAFESIRLLTKQPLPFWPSDAGAIRGFPGMTSMLFAYPGSWFVQLFGENEAAARVPFLLYLLTLYFAIVAIVRTNRSLRALDYWLIWIGLLVYTIVVAFSATYSPYAADIALPATQDTLLVVCFLGFVIAFLNNRKGAIVLFTLLTFLSLPSGALLIAIWIAAVFLLWKPFPKSPAVTTILAVFGCLLLSLLVPSVLAWFDHPVPGKEYESSSLLMRLAALEWKEWKRILFVLTPCGIAPVLAALYWKSHNVLSRTLYLVAGGYFIFFYFQRQAVLHHFIPAMILPLPAFWQNDVLLNSGRRSVSLAGIIILGAVAFVLSLPLDGSPDTRARSLGHAIEDRLGGYQQLSPEGFRVSVIFHKLFPPSWDRSVPQKSYGGSAIVWYHYANRTAFRENPESNYIFQRSEDPAPEGMRLIATHENVALYMRSDAVLKKHRSMRPNAPVGSDIYRTDRRRLFQPRR